jgi:hypothetical protein
MWSVHMPENCIAPLVKTDTLQLFNLKRMPLYHEMELQISISISYLHINNAMIVVDTKFWR